MATSTNTTTSDRRRAAARANGAKSRGPVTPEGKARSAANATRHGLTAATSVNDTADSICLFNEDRDAFTRLHEGLIAKYLPTDLPEELLVQEMAVARWRQQRLWVIEGALMDKQISANEPTARQEQGDLLDDRLRVALAFEHLAERGPSLSLLIRYENRLSRQFQRCLDRLLAGRAEAAAEDAVRNEPNPENEHHEEDDSQHADTQPSTTEPLHCGEAIPVCPETGQRQPSSFDAGSEPDSAHPSHRQPSHPAEPAPEGDLPLAA
ncbi:MAG: hypothetical protein IT162_23650 [Bryobacterales bacterium]|nr:hypothetical protein [Bryobacterales bacterium]